MNYNFYQLRLFLYFYFRWNSFKSTNSCSQEMSKDPKISVNSRGLSGSPSSLLPAVVSLIHPPSMWMQNWLWKMMYRHQVFCNPSSIFYANFEGGVSGERESHLGVQKMSHNSLHFSLCPTVWSNYLASPPKEHFQPHQTRFHLLSSK